MALRLRICHMGVFLLFYYSWLGRPTRDAIYLWLGWNIYVRYHLSLSFHDEKGFFSGAVPLYPYWAILGGSKHPGTQHSMTANLLKVHANVQVRVLTICSNGSHYRRIAENTTGEDARLSAREHVQIVSDAYSQINLLFAELFNEQLMQSENYRWVLSPPQNTA